MCLKENGEIRLYLTPQNGSLTEVYKIYMNEPWPHEEVLWKIVLNVLQSYKMLGMGISIKAILVTIFIWSIGSASECDNSWTIQLKNEKKNQFSRERILKSSFVKPNQSVQSKDDSRQLNTCDRVFCSIISKIKLRKFPDIYGRFIWDSPVTDQENSKTFLLKINISIPS